MAITDRKNKYLLKFQIHIEALLEFAGIKPIDDHKKSWIVEAVFSPTCISYTTVIIFGDVCW